MNQGALFNHTHQLVGRDETLVKVRGFLTDDRRVAILVGPGGVGKSRLLLELATIIPLAEQPPRIRFVASGIEITEDVFRELPSGRLCIVIDDAHRVERLDALVTACLQHNEQAKLPGELFMSSGDAGVGSVCLGVVGNAYGQSLIQGFFHGRLDGPNEIAFSLEVCRVRDDLKLRATPTQKTETHSIAAEADRQHGDECAGCLLEALVLNHRGQQLEYDLLSL